MVIQWLFSQGNTPTQNEIQDALETLLSATPDQYQKVLETQQDILLAENTLITLCLTILQYQQTADAATINMLLITLYLLDYAKSHSIAEACTYTSDNTELALPAAPASRMINLLTNAREHIEETRHQQIWGRLHQALGDYYIAIAQQQPAEEQSTSLTQAMSCYNIALPILTEDTYPYEHAVIQFQLFTLYSQAGKMEQAQNALLKARDTISTWVQMQDQQQPAPTGTLDEVVPTETLTDILNAFLEVPYGDALQSYLQEHQAVLQSKQARTQLRELIAEIASSNMDGRTEYLTVRLQLLEAIYAFGLENAWRVFMTEQAHALQLVQNIQAGGNYDAVVHILQTQSKTFVTTSVLALLHVLLLDARRNNNAFMAPVIEMTIKGLKIVRQQQSAPSSQVVTEQTGQYQDILQGFVLPDLIKQQIPTFLQNEGFNDPYFVHILQEGQQLGPTFLQQMLPIFAQIGQTKNIRAPEMADMMAQPWLNSLDRQKTPYLWATALLMQNMVYLHKLTYDYEQVLRDCDTVLEIFQGAEGSDMWMSAMVIHGMVELSFLLEDDSKPRLTVAEKRLRVERAIADLTAALSVPTKSTFPMIPALATASRGLAYMQLELYGKPDAQLLNKAEADFAAALPVLRQEGTVYQWNKLFLQRATLYYRLMQKDVPMMFQQAIADCNEVIKACQPPHPQELAEIWAAALMIRGLVYMNYADKGSRRANMEQAIADFNTAMKATRNRDQEEWARAIVNRGLAYTQRIEGDRSQNIEHALKDFTQALPILTEQRFPFEWAALLIGRASCYAQRQAYDRAHNQDLALQDFSTVLTSLPEEDWTATMRAQAFAGRGNIYLQRLAGEPRTNLPLAIADYDAALALFTPDVQPVWRASVLLNRGTTYRTLGLSFSLTQRGMGFRALLPKIVTPEGIGLHALLRDSQHHFDHALQDFDQALSILTREATPLEWAKTYEERAMTHACMSYRFFGESAETHRQQAITDYSTALLALTPEDYPLDWAITLSNRAIHYGECITGKNSQEVLLALADTDAAMTVFTRQAAPAHYRRLQHIRADIFEKIEDWPAAHEAFQAIRQVQRDLVASASNTMNSIDLVAELALANIYTRHAQVMLRLAETDLTKVILALEEGRAQTLRSELDLDTIRLDKIRQPEARARMDAFKNARNQWRKSQSHMLESLSDLTEAGREKERRRQALEQAYRAFLQTRKAIQVHDDPAFMTSLPKFSAITTAIEDPSMALVYLVPDDSLDYRRGMAMLVTLDRTGSPQVRHLPLPELTELALFDLFDIKDDAPPQIRFEDAINQLGRLGLQRVADVLWEDGIRHIMCVAYGWSGVFPIPATLIKRADGNTVAMNKLFEMTMAPSVITATAAREHLRSPKQQRRMLLFAGNPQPLSEQAPDLPGAEAEAQTLRRIARRYGYPTAHICYLSRNTVVKSSLTEALERARYAHLALHGRYNVEQPRASRLLLARQGQPEDAYITLAEILDQTFDLQGLRLLVLSACETSIIDMRRTPDEVLGIAAAFQKAGVATIIAALWPVDDEATYLLMSRFAQLYLDPQNLWTPARALGEAQHWLRTEATNKVLEEYDPFPARATLRSVRHTYANMITNIHIKASRADPDTVPYRDAFYWAGFVAIGS